MHKSNIGYRAWAVGIHLMTASLKGVSSMRLHCDLGITQKSAWMMMHKIRETLDDESGDMSGGPVEVDETFIGGKHGHNIRGNGTIDQMQWIVRNMEGRQLPCRDLIK